MVRWLSFPSNCVMRLVMNRLVRTNDSKTEWDGGCGIATRAQLQSNTALIEMNGKLLVLSMGMEIGQDWALSKKITLNGKVERESPVVGRV